MIDNQVHQLPIGKIDAGPYQPRTQFNAAALTELAESIRHQGLLQPLVVRQMRDRYQIIAGERRFRAAKQLGMTHVPALVRRMTDEEALEAALVENVQREDLTPAEEARAYRRLEEEFGYTHGEIGRRTGKSRTAIVNTLRLLQLPEAVLGLLDTGELTEGHARALLSLPYPSLQAEMAEWIVQNAVPVRETEERVRRLQALPDGGGKAPARAARPADVHVADIEEKLRRRFGTKATVAYRKGKGSLRLEFYTDDDLARLLELLAAE